LSEGGECERTTIDQYRQHLDLHIDPIIGQLKLSDLSAQTVRKFEDKLRHDGRSPAMIRKILVSLGSILADAQEQGLAARNAVRDLRRNRRKGKERNAEARQKGKLKIGVDIPTPDEIKAILAHARPRWRPFSVTAVCLPASAHQSCAGCAGLMWTKVNELHVRQRADRYRKIGKPKSAAGERAVPFGKFVANTLKEWKLTCPKGENGLVFPNRHGGIEFHPHVIQRGLIPAVIAARLEVGGKAKYTGLHSLRHFYASWCINRPQDGGLGLPPNSYRSAWAIPRSR
jgi:integrase